MDQQGQEEAWKEKIIWRKNKNSDKLPEIKSKSDPSFG
jgi:hypothetical protein